MVDEVWLINEKEARPRIIALGNLGMYRVYLTH